MPCAEWPRNASYAIGIISALWIGQVAVIRSSSPVRRSSPFDRRTENLDDQRSVCQFAKRIGKLANWIV